MINCLETISDSNDSQIPNTYIFKLPTLTYSTMASTIFRNDIVLGFVELDPEAIHSLLSGFLIELQDNQIRPSQDKSAQDSR